MFDTTDVQRFVLSSIGALLLSAACVVGAVGPAKAGSAPTLTERRAAPETVLSCSPAIPLKLQ
jgi:hypothetical protein